MANRFEEWGKKYGLIAAILTGLAIWAIPTPATMTVTQHKLLAIFGGAVVAWITIGINFAVSTFAIITLLYFWVGNPDGKLDKAGQLIRNADFAVGGFASSSLWLLVTGFVISIAMTKSGVAKRLALHMMRIWGRTPAGAVYASMLANFIIAPLTPSNTARTAAMLPIMEGIAEAYQAVPGRSNFGKALMLAGTFTSNITGSAFLTGTIPNPVAVGMIAAAAGASLYTTWSYWALAAVPTNIIILYLTGRLLLKMFPPEVTALPGGVDYIKQELAAMGPMSAREKKAIFYFLVALVLWSTDIFHKFNSTMVAFLVSLLIFIPKIGVLEWKETEKSLPWELFVYFGGVLTLSGALMKTKAFEWLIKTLLATLGLQNIPMMPLLIILIGFSIFSHVIWSTTTAMAGVMIPIYIGLAQTLGFNVVAFVLPLAIMMAYALFLPFNTMGNIIMFGTGYYTVTEQIKSSVVLGLIIWGLWIVTAFTWWKWIGLL
ncbi:SLC13 family permease [Sporolituus thermophilus]|uniref:Anion transporter n=1 Tax=Sporolituus thermophilus DSM 23256 TaxID=1123285 RepID=A0A1G7PAX2_9FIRM|nr:DASS family sodium-coupled anion symporter [Sporolituus thermophilus]SDF83267.1 anion transporter [Sporolituus thermophilus DSM 23256]